MLLCTLGCLQRDLCQIQHLQDVGVAHLILNGNTQEIKILDRILGFQRKKRNLLLPHHFVHIIPRRIDTLTPGILSFVKHIVENLNAQMGHSNLIHIRETHGEPDVYLFLVLHDRIDFTTDIAGRFLNGHQDLI